MNKFKDDFDNPPVICRGKPFWAWNNLCEEHELRRQIRIFKEMGFGGFFMHSRTGLKTKYLGEKWFDAIKNSIDEANKIGLEAWLYDEDRWPSGTAGGLVTKDTQYQMKCLKFKKIDIKDFSWKKYCKDTFVFAVYFSEDKLSKYIPITKEDDLKTICKADCFLVFNVGIIASSTQYNGKTYLDTLNPEAVHEFIKITHEAYLNEVGDRFGSTVPGIFTDEPNCNDGWNKQQEITWSDILPDYFQKHFGYDVTKKLPELFFDLTTQLYSKTRYDYYVCRARMFTEAYAAQIGIWCGKHRLALTGHGICEYPLSEQAMWTGSLMPFYSHMQIPGIDMLTDYTNEYMTPKQCSSVARQFGRKWVLSELYGCTGWDTTFAGYKYMGDWQAVLGITMRCLHLSWYSMAGEAKRDYPASIHFHSPWWKQYKYIEDYFARINNVLSEGTPICDTAFINPVECFYFLLRPDISSERKDENIKKYDDLYDQLNNWILSAHIDFDFIDEELLQTQDYEILCENETFLRIGQMKYKLILVPETLTIRSSTLQLLEMFAKQGGKVLFIGNAPEFIDGEPSKNARIFAKNKCISINKEILTKQLKSFVGKVHIKDKNGNELDDIFCQLRKVDDSFVLFIVNTNSGKKYDNTFVTICDSSIGLLQVQLWDAANNKKFAIPNISSSSSEVKFVTDISAGGSLLFVIMQHKEQLPNYVKISQNDKYLIKNDSWDYTLDDENVIVLDRADCTLMRDECQIMQLCDNEILQIDDLVRKELAYPLRTGTAIQPWTKEKKGAANNVTMKLNYEFLINEIPVSGIKLAMEQPENWQISLNGHTVNAASSINDWWVDPAIKKLQIPTNFLQKGGNKLSIQGRFSEDTDLEIIYLIGNFGVETDGKRSSIIKLPDKLAIGSVTKQGLPFYSGNIFYKSSFYFETKPGLRYWLALEDINATAAEISINGSDMMLMGMPDYKVEITDLLKNGQNNICINLLGSRHNAFGPLHMANKRPVYISSAAFRKHENYYKWQEGYNLIEYGLYGYPVIYS
ncbi:MAG: hypothetical protein A2Y12_19585 [Planctomycetes bacterium GWF2_42_9]|nr:MAG: hypothetical protein A2Y12_19585 [Planctomycetes bacterium GWF2_42_9]